MSHIPIITDAEVKRAHTVPSKNLSCEFAEDSSCSENLRIDKLSLKNNEGYIFDKDILWNFFKEKDLVGREIQGKVAFLHSVKLKPRKKARGLFSELHAEQFKVLKDNEFNQIQLEAKWDGVIVWPSLFFKFDDEDDEDQLFELISNYMIEVLGYNTAKTKSIIKLTNKIKDLNKYLKPSNREWFTIWYQKEQKSLKYKMHKDIV